MLTVDVSTFEDRHAELQVELGARAFAGVPEGARPKETPAFVGHIHGESNPAGAARLAFTRDGDRVVGSVAGVPYRFRRRDGTLVTGWQIGTFVVDQAVQRQGIGARMLNALTAELRRLPDSFVYSYPNGRSIPVFDRNGYVRVQTVPTRIYLPGPGAPAGFEARRIPASEVPSALAALAPTEGPAGFVRDARYFQWRFLGPDAERRYRFLLCRARDSCAGFVLALARHRFAGLSFGVVADACPDVLDRWWGAALRAARGEARGEGAWLLYANTNVERLGAARERPGAVPWSVTVPDGRNPRPIVLVLHAAGGAADPAEVAASLAMTADWGGF